MIPLETTDHDVPTPERETQTTGSSDRIRVLAEESEFTPSVETVAAPQDGMHISIPSETVSIPESGIESTTTTTTDNESDQKGEIQQSADVKDVVETVSFPECGTEATTTTTDNVSDSENTIQTNDPTDVEETLFTILKSVGVQKDEVEISISTKTVPVGGRPKYSWTIVLTGKPETTGRLDEVMPTIADGIESTIEETVAEIKDWKKISTPTETVSSPESLIGITDSADNESDSEIKTEVTNVTDNAPGGALLPSLHPLTTQEEPTEDKPHSSGESGQPAQKTSTTMGRYQSFFSKIRAFFRKKKREDTSKGKNSEQYNLQVG